MATELYLNFDWAQNQDIFFEPDLRILVKQLIQYEGYGPLQSTFDTSYKSHNKASAEDYDKGIVDSILL